MTCEQVAQVMYGFPDIQDAGAMYAAGFGLVILPWLVAKVAAIVVRALNQAF